MMFIIKIFAVADYYYDIAADDENDDTAVNVDADIYNVDLSVCVTTKATAISLG